MLHSEVTPALALSEGRLRDTSFSNSHELQIEAIEQENETATWTVTVVGSLHAGSREGLNWHQKCTIFLGPTELMRYVCFFLFRLSESIQRLEYNFDIREAVLCYLSGPSAAGKNEREI